MENFSEYKRENELTGNEVEGMVYFSNKLEMPFITLSCYEIPQEVIRLIPEKICRNHQAIPIARIGPALTVAVADPLNILILDELHNLTELEIHPVVSMPSDIINALDFYHNVTVGEISKTEVMDEEGVKIEAVAMVENEEVDIDKLTDLVEDSSVVNTVNDSLSLALKQNASDIHIEPFEDTLRIRNRVDGMLTESHLLSKEIQEGFIARLKIMSKLDITQRRLPQDGRFSLKFDNRDIDFRVSVLPTNFGEKIVLRILDKGGMKLDLKNMGFSAQPLEIYQKAIHAPFGMILITGPTGSGKTSTLYSMLNQLNTLDKNIVTIEDPIEYNLAGVTQIQTKSEIGLDFANVLRSTLRQSPDIIMLGEIRDTETADIAMKAALTGHLVLSTLHTNNAPSSIPRLMDMGIEPFLIAGSVVMISAQRLCRRLCASCKAKEPLKADELAKKISLSLGYNDQIETYKPVGCQQCNNTGYQGRIAVVEAFMIDDTMRQMILSRSPSAEIKKYAQEHLGMKTLREDGFEKVVSGTTSLEEVIRVTAEF